MDFIFVLNHGLRYALYLKVFVDFLNWNRGISYGLIFMILEFFLQVNGTFGWELVPCDFPLVSSEYHVNNYFPLVVHAQR